MSPRKRVMVEEERECVCASVGRKKRMRGSLCMHVRTSAHMWSCFWIYGNVLVFCVSVVISVGVCVCVFVWRQWLVCLKSQCCQRSKGCWHHSQGPWRKGNLLMDEELPQCFASCVHKAHWVCNHSEPSHWLQNRVFSLFFISVLKLYLSSLSKVFLSWVWEIIFPIFSSCPCSKTHLYLSIGLSIYLSIYQSCFLSCSLFRCLLNLYLDQR